MKIPEGVEVDEETRKTKIWKLNKTIYGLKISSKKWNKKFSEEVRKLNIESDLHKPCLFTCRKKVDLL